MLKYLRSLSQKTKAVETVKVVETVKAVETVPKVNHSIKKLSAILQDKRLQEDLNKTFYIVKIENFLGLKTDISDFIIREGFVDKVNILNLKTSLRFFDSLKDIELIISIIREYDIVHTEEQLRALMIRTDVKHPYGYLLFYLKQLITTIRIKKFDIKNKYDIDEIRNNLFIDEETYKLIAEEVYEKAMIYIIEHDKPK